MHRKAKLATYKAGLSLAEFSRRAIQKSLRQEEEAASGSASGGKRLQ